MRKLLSLLTVTCLLGSLQQGALAEADQALMMSGKSSQFGFVRFEVCSTAININAKTGSMLWLAAQPNRANVLNTETKNYYVDTLPEWIVWARRFLPEVKIDQVLFVEDCKLLGQKCKKYAGYRKTDGGKQVVSEFWCLEKNPYPDLVNNVWCSFFRLPPKYGFPIQVRQRCDSNWVHLFDITELKKVPASTRPFKIASDWHRVKDKATLYFGMGGDDMKASDIEDIFAQPLK